MAKYASGCVKYFCFSAVRCWPHIPFTCSCILLRYRHNPYDGPWPYSVAVSGAASVIFLCGFLVREAYLPSLATQSEYDRHKASQRVS